MKSHFYSVALFLFLTFSLATASFNLHSEDYGPDWIENVRLTPTISSTTTYKTISPEEKSVDMALSHVSVLVGQDILDGIRQEFQKSRYPQNSDDGNPGTTKVIGLRVKFSFVPMIVQDSVTSDLNDRLEAKISQARSHYYTQIETQIPAALRKNPRLPASLRPLVEKQLIASAKADVDQKLSHLQRMGERTIKKRVEDMELETSLQELSLIFQVTGTQKDRHIQSVVFVKVGKQFVEGGPMTDLNNQTTDEAIMGVNSPVDKSLTASTGAVRFSYYNHHQSEGIQFLVDAYVFHDRPPFESGHQYISTLATLPEQRYDETREWYQLDSTLIRALIQDGPLSAYATLGYFKGSGTAESLGASAAITPQDHLSIAFTQGRDEFLHQGVEVTYSHDLNPWTTIFVDYQSLKGLRHPLYVKETSSSSFTSPIVSFDQALAGAKFKLMNQKLGPHYHARLDITLAAVTIFNPSANADLDKYGFQGALHLTVEENPTTPSPGLFDHLKPTSPPPPVRKTSPIKKIGIRLGKKLS